MTKEQIKAIFASNGYTITSEERINNNLGDVLRLENGGIINCYDTGKCVCQGKNISEIKALLERCGDTSISKNRKVFVVY